MSETHSLLSSCASSSFFTSVYELTCGDAHVCGLVQKGGQVLQKSGDNSQRALIKRPTDQTLMLQDARKKASEPIRCYG